MAVRMSFHCHGSTSFLMRVKASFLLLFFSVSAVCCNQVVVQDRVSAVVGRNVTLACRVEVGANLSLTQSSWERKLPSGSATLAVFNPEFGISIAPEYIRRLYFQSPSARDATIVLEDVGFADVGVYTCKVATFPLGNTQAFTTVDVMVEPQVYVSAGSVALLDGGNETVVATCTAERGRPRAEVSWESELFGRSDIHHQDEPNGTTTSQARYLWRPNRHAQGHSLTCVVRHPALSTEFRIPYVLNVQFGPDLVLTGYDGNWYVGREGVRLQCRVHANPPAHYVSWSRVGEQMPDGVEEANGTLVFTRPLERNDSGEYQCEAGNDLGRRSRDIYVLIQEPPPTTTTFPTTAAPVAAGHPTGVLPNKRGPKSGSPTLASLTDSSLGTIVGGAVGGALFLVLLLVLGGVCYCVALTVFRRAKIELRRRSLRAKPNAWPPPLTLYFLADHALANPTSSVAVAGAVIGAILALFIIAVFTIVLLTPPKSQPPTYMDKVIDLPPTHKPPPAYTERPVALPLAVNTAQVYYPSQLRSGDRQCRPKMSVDVSSTVQRRENLACVHEPLSYQEWLCHLNGADRVYANHREHYV
ncbi:hypothetical protein GJAV_G00051280 [Gymnothorax javanicus]|nr:hypothetical protein GJAV_G00051280 [Gymnothorax javanicus]